MEETLFENGKLKEHIKKEIALTCRYLKDKGRFEYCRKANWLNALKMDEFRFDRIENEVRTPLRCGNWYYGISSTPYGYGVSYHDFQRWALNNKELLLKHYECCYVKKRQNIILDEPLPF